MSGQRKIIPLGTKAGYFEARTLAKERGGKLPSNVLHDQYLVRSDRWRELAGYYAAWARELLVYPEKGGKFEGKDIVDSETGWILPASYVPKEAFGRKGVGLFIDPEDVVVKNGKTVIHSPSGIVVLTNVIQENRNSGVVDGATGIPLALGSESDMDKRWLWRIDGVGVRPLARIGGVGGYGGQYVVANFSPTSGLGVALEVGAPQREPQTP